MPVLPANGYKLVVGTAFMVAVLGGIWRGVASCGGYAWHGQLMQWVLIASALFPLIYMPGRAPSLLRRLALSASILATFFLVQALAAPFYPSFSGFGDYIHRVGLALSYGPC